MKLYSTNNKDNIVDLKEAVLNAFPLDRGLYLPCGLKSLSSGFIEEIGKNSFTENCFYITRHLFGNALSVSEIELLIENTIRFPAMVKTLSDDFSTLELFHGPTMAFKDFGACFMANLMSILLKDEDRKTTILVATSGDTGGAVASGFYGKENIDVIILYPSGKVSPLQEKQLTAWGGNIKAIEVNGVFDDCQRLVKNAFVDDTLRKKYKFSSANSINIARLIPQSFYYFEGYKQLLHLKKDIVFSVPSGNFGNLTAGVLAKMMGLPITGFIAAVNANKTFYDYIQTGIYTPRASVSTLSNAMDVGDPSNFIRLNNLYGSTWNFIKKDISCFHYDNKTTTDAIRYLYQTYNYISDPHGALAFKACFDHKEKHKTNCHYLFLETAHPAKFLETVQPLIDKKIVLPEQLERFIHKKKQALACSNNYLDFKELLLEL